MRQTNASAAIQEDLLDVALDNERLIQARVSWLRTNALIWTGLATCLCVLVGLLVVNEIFYWTLRKEIQRKQLAPSNAILTATHAQEQNQLTRYQWIKRSDGILRIPLERAKGLVVADYARSALAASAASAPLLSKGANAAGGTGP